VRSSATAEDLPDASFAGQQETFLNVVGFDDVIDKIRHVFASLYNDRAISYRVHKGYAHADVDALRAALQAADGRERFVVTESIFSMDGDLAPLGQMLELCEQHDAWLVIDDAHGFGVLGREGRGVLQALGLCSDRIIYVGTLGKAAGISGAFVAGADAVVETLLQKARSYIYTTAMPPFLAAGLQQSLDIIQAESWRRSQLQQLIATLKQGLAGTALRLLPSDSPIQPLLLGSNASAMAASTRLREQGLIVTAIRPPTVPVGTARLRLSLSALHQLDDVQCLVQALRDLSSEMPQSSSLGTA
jgi:8-amino-7-oxononanoate synthase